jgi:hypothetical protein
MMARAPLGSAIGWSALPDDFSQPSIVLCQWRGIGLNRV